MCPYFPFCFLGRVSLGIRAVIEGEWAELGLNSQMEAICSVWMESNGPLYVRHPSEYTAQKKLSVTNIIHIPPFLCHKHKTKLCINSTTIISLTVIYANHNYPLWTQKNKQMCVACQSLKAKSFVWNELEGGAPLEWKIRVMGIKQQN